MKTKTILAVLASLLATAVFAFDPPPVGSAAPDFSLTDAKGKPHSLSQYKGKGVVWLTIDSNAPGTEGSLSTDAANKVMADWKTRQSALLLDPEGRAGRAYGAKNTPNMVVINPDGKIVYEGAIDSKATPNPADIPNSTNYVKAALD